jgi:glycerophosphoryl diester phosphodiesterase
MIIAHRGNINGPNPSTENREETIARAIELGLDCEIDVWKTDGRLWLGHDGPEHETTISFLAAHRPRLWVHCKNLDALIALKDEYNCFFHDKDTYTLTSKGYIWGNVGSPMTTQTILVMPEKANMVCTEYLGVCTDYPFRYS